MKAKIIVRGLYLILFKRAELARTLSKIFYASNIHSFQERSSECFYLGWSNRSITSALISQSKARRVFVSCMLTMRQSSKLTLRLQKAIPSSFIRIATLPYYRTFERHTLNPLCQIQECTSESELYEALHEWRKGRLHELKFVQVAVWSQPGEVLEMESASC